MTKFMKKTVSLLVAGIMVFSLAACSSDEPTSQAEQSTTSESTGTTESSQTADTSDENVTIKITWWRGQTRHDYTQVLLDAYTASHPNITFEAVPSG